MERTNWFSHWIKTRTLGASLPSEEEIMKLQATESYGAAKVDGLLNILGEKVPYAPGV